MALPLAHGQMLGYASSMSSKWVRGIGFGALALLLATCSVARESDDPLTTAIDASVGANPANSARATATVASRAVKDEHRAPTLPGTALSFTPGSFQPSAAGGTGIVIGVGDASPWLVGDNAQNIYHYNNDSPPPRAWVPEPNSAGTKSLAVGPDGKPWKIDSNSLVWKQTAPGTWAPMGAPFHAWEIGVGRDSAWAISQNCNGNGDCDIYQWNGSSWWLMCGGLAAGCGAQHVAVAPDGTTYVSNAGGALYKWNGSSFQAFGPPGTCVQHNSIGGASGVPVIGAGPNDSVWVLGCAPGFNRNQYIYAWSASLGTWQQVSGTARSISVGADGTPWVINGTTNAIYEYVSSWENVGPRGFTMTDTGRRWSGEIHDIAVTGSALAAGATGGGVWSYQGGWYSIGDVGAGVNAQGAAPAGGPNMSIGTIAIKPNDPNTLVVGTGVADAKLNNGINADGNGIWYTHNASGSVTWKEALCGISHAKCLFSTKKIPTAKIRYTADSSRIWAATKSGLYTGTQDPNGDITLFEAGSTCAPNGNITDLVVDPNDPNTAWFGTSSGGGIYLTIDAGASCVSTFPAWMSPNTDVALAITSGNPAVLFASLAAGPAPDFQGIYRTTRSSFPALTLAQGPTSPAFPSGFLGLNSQTGHNWALAVDSTGSTILAGGSELWRFTGCQSVPFAGMPQHVQAPPFLGNGLDGHADHHAIVFGSSSQVYDVNDGGVFVSNDAGVTWSSSINTPGVANVVSVSVGPGSIFTSSWDVGSQYSMNQGSNWYSVNDIAGCDGHQAFVDPASPYHGFACGDTGRFRFDAANWTNIDSPLAQNVPCNLAKGSQSNLFTLSQDKVFQSSSEGTLWSQYLAGLALPSTPASPAWSILATNELPASVYVSLSSVAPSAPPNALQLYVSANGHDWQYATVPTNWPTGYNIGRSVSILGGADVALDSVTSDVYIAGMPSADGTPARIYGGAGGLHGASWRELTGCPNGNPCNTGNDLGFNPNEVVNSIAVDPAAHSVLVATNGTKPSVVPLAYPGAGIYRLNNADVLDDAVHHWRPWVHGLPNGQQPVMWITGQYENGVYYYYIATWGRGVWRREARGGDF